MKGVMVLKMLLHASHNRHKTEPFIAVLLHFSSPTWDLKVREREGGDGEGGREGRRGERERERERERGREEGRGGGREGGREGGDINCMLQECIQNAK